MEQKVTLIVPITHKNMIAPAKLEGAGILYTGYGKFIKNGKFSLEQLAEYTQQAKAHRIKLFLSLGPEIFESHFEILKEAFVNLTSEHIDGLLLNNYALLTLLKEIKKPDNFPEIFMGKGLNLHNIASCELVSAWRPAALNITEEVYLKNVTRIKKYTAKNVFISINDTIWLMNYALDWGLNTFIIYGKYKDPDRLCLLISSIRELVEKIQTQDKFDNQLIERIVNLLDSSDSAEQFKTDHFTCKFKDFSGNDFEFTGNIKHFAWDESSIRLNTPEFPTVDKRHTRLRLRLTRLEQLYALEKFIRSEGQGIIDIVEFGDIISPKELSKQSYASIINSVKRFCNKYNIDFFLTTPSVLIERDIDNVAMTMKTICYKDPRPAGLVINNPGLWKYICNTRKLRDLIIELGDGLGIYNSRSIQFFKKSHPLNGVNIPNDLDLEYIEKLVNNTELEIRSLVIAGVSKLRTSGLCPMNNDLAIISRLQCLAPCQKSSYAIKDPFSNTLYPMILDGFCRFHLVKSTLDDYLPRVDSYINAGITDFILDCRGLPSATIIPMIQRYCLALKDSRSYKPINTTKNKNNNGLLGTST